MNCQYCTVPKDNILCLSLPCHVNVFGKIHFQTINGNILISFGADDVTHLRVIRSSDDSHLSNISMCVYMEMRICMQKML